MKASTAARELVSESERALDAESGERDAAVFDPGDDLDERDRADLHEALRRSWASARAGRTVSVEELFQALDADE